jgi:hypothetical protein
MSTVKPLTQGITIGFPTNQSTVTAPFTSTGTATSVHAVQGQVFDAAGTPLTPVLHMTVPPPNWQIPVPMLPPTPPNQWYTLTVSNVVGDSDSVQFRC